MSLKPDGAKLRETKQQQQETFSRHAAGVRNLQLSRWITQQATTIQERN